MRLPFGMRVLATGVAMLILCLNGMGVSAQNAVPQSSAPEAPRGPPSFPVDPRVQVRTYHFTDTNEDIPYALFVSSKVKPGKRAPLIVTLHGLGGELRLHAARQRAGSR